MRLSLPEIKLGVLPSYGGTQFLPPMIGKSRALDLMMTGRAVTAEEALSMGMIDRLANSGEVLLEASEKLASEILAHRQFALDRLRRCVDGATQGVTDEGLAIEAAAVVETMGSEEGVMAFLEKRTPRFKHR